MLIGDQRRADHRRKVRGHALARRRRDSAEHGGEISDQVPRCGREVRLHREEVGEARRIEERDLRAADRRLAHPVREQRHLATQVGTDDQQSLQRIHLRERHAQPGKHRIRVLIAEVALPQPMIDVVGVEAARQARRKIQLLQGAGAVREHAQLRRAGTQPLRHLRERALPVGGKPFAAATHHGV